MNASRLGLRDRRSLDGVTGDPRDALKSKSTWTDEDGVGRVKRDGGVRGMAETGHVSTSRWSRGDQGKMDGLGKLGLKTTTYVGRFPGLDLKTKGVSGAAGSAEWRTWSTIAKLASRRRKS
jgi:hypothetical protein